MFERKLTSKNLFDDIFVGIPQDEQLDCGPSSLREERAFAQCSCTVQVSHGYTSRNARGGGVEDGDDAFTVETDDNVTTRNISLEHSVPLSMRIQTFAPQRVSAASGSKNTTSIQLEVHMEEDDEAVREATRYAGYLEQSRQEETVVEAVQHHDEIQSTALSLKVMPPGNTLTEARKDSELRRLSGGQASNAPPESVSAPGRASSQFVVADQNAGASSRAHAMGRKNVTAEDQLALMQPGSTHSYTGRCAMFRHAKGFGFLSPDMGGPDVYFVRDAVPHLFTMLVLRKYYEMNHKPVPPSIHTITSALAIPAPERESSSGEGGKGTAVEANTQPLPTTSTHAASGLCEGAAPPDRVLTPKMQETIAQGALLLTASSAQLLQFQVDTGRATLRLLEPVLFTVHRNKAARSSGRLLRAEDIRGAASHCYAIQIEQTWFYPLFKQDITRRQLRENEVSTAVNTKGCDQSCSGTSMMEAHKVMGENTGNPSILERYEGVVRSFDAEDQCGYIRSQDVATQDVFFFSDAILWEGTCSMDRRSVREGLRVRYSMAGSDRNGKQLGTLITALDDRPFSLSSMHYVEVNDYARKMGRNDEGDDSQRGSNSVAGTTARRDQEGGRGESNERKRPRDEDELLLFAEDDYAML